MKRRVLMARIAAVVLSATFVSSLIEGSTFAYQNEIIMAAEAESQSSEVKADDYKSIGGITNYSQDENKVTFELSTGEKLRVSFLEGDVFRIYMDPKGEFQEDPTPNGKDHITKIIDKKESEYERTVPVVVDGETIVVSTDTIELRIEKATSKMELLNKKTNKTLWKESEPLKYKNGETIQTLETNDAEYFYGGGMQNGRFSHKGKSINIKNENNWVDGGVASPNPFYWSTNGYGVMRHTFKPGVYAFGSADKTKVTTMHSETRFDAYYFVDDTPTGIINQFTDLTGKPALLPEYAFYLGHANCYSRDWINDATGQESQTQKPGFDRQESLMVDGKKVVDDHVGNDMPLGWFLPNDGYGCGYGREDSVDGNIDNLKQFVDYSKGFGVQTGLWTQSQLMPTGNQPAYLERDIEKEVGVAGTNGVKTDVAWVGAGYSFALNSVRQAAEGIMNNSKDSARPFVVTVDGWAGTQRYSSVWSGDQYGGTWEYIRFHIPTYIGTGLSGQPNVGSDMDGIFGGNKLIQTRDFQWKAFTPVQIDMDGWGSNAKNPYVFGEPYTSINRMYLKLKAEMMPYNYSIASESTNTGMPMIRAMMLEYPEAHTYGTATEYQYMWGPNLLVAPVYQNTNADAIGNDIRNDIYLPDEDQVWIDYFSGEQYSGGGVLNNFEAPVWKLPLFVKNGAIIPMTSENNNAETMDDSKRIYEVYPSGDTSFEAYEDDGATVEYLEGHSATTLITSTAPKTGKGTAVIKAGLLEGSYSGMVAERETEFVVNVSEKPSSLSAKIGGSGVQLTEAKTLEEFEAGTNMYFYDEQPDLNKYGTGDFADVKITTTPKVYVKVAKTDVTKNEVELTVNDFINVQPIDKNEINESLSTPANFRAVEETITPTSIELAWDEVEGATSYDVEIDGVVYKDIKNGHVHNNLDYDTTYNYRVRSVNADGYSQWSETISPKTALDPYRNVPRDMKAIWDGGQYSSDYPWKALDNDNNSQFHSAGNAINKPFIVDMNKAYSIEKLELLFRANGNGSVRRAEIYSSLDGVTYEKIFSNAADTGNPAWPTDGAVKTINFDKPIDARYFKIVTKESVGNFLTMREFRPYKVDGTTGKVVGDWNNSGTIEEGDLVFLQNYAGLTTVDADWDYVSAADLNGNGIIDAYDIAYVANKLEGGVKPGKDEMAGELMLLPSKTDLKAGEEFTVDVIGMGLADINSFSAGITIDPNKYEIVSDPVETISTSEMMNLSKKRIHTDGTQDVYVMFANVGDKTKVKGTDSLSRFTLKAKVDTTFDLEMTHGLIVDSKANSREAIAEITDVNADLPVGKPTKSKINKSAITVKGDATQLQAGMGLDKLIDGTTSSDDSSRMDLKWVFNPDQADKGTLPFEMTFTFDKAREFDNFTIYNRINANGTLNIAALKKVKAVGYLNGVATDLGEKVNVQNNVQHGTTVYDLGGQKFDKIVITALECFKDQHTLAINEIEFYEKSGKEVTGIDFESNTVDTLYQNKLTPIFANVTPDDANNLYYRITSSDPEVVQVIRIDSGDDVNYYLKGNKSGVATITASTANGEFTVEKNITVGEGVDKALLVEALERGKPHVALNEIYTAETYGPFAEAIKAAEAIVAKDDATESEVSEAIRNIRTTMEALVERATIEGDYIHFDKIEATDATSEADSDYKENAVDGDDGSIWHSGYQAADKLPVSLTLKLDQPYELNQIDYLPRQSSRNGHVTKYRIETSLDGENWTVAREGNLKANAANTALENTGYNPIRFNTVKAEYVRFTALESLGDTNNKYASVAELKFYGKEEVVEQANKFMLEFAVGIAKEVTQEQLDKVVPVVRDEFLAALAEAEAILANERATQAQVDASFDRVAKAMQYLEFIAGDKTQLITFIEKLEDLKEEEYIASSWQSFVAALGEAKDIVADENALVEDVNKAYDSLVKSYLELRFKPNKDKLQELINKVKTLDSTKYTNESWSLVESKLKRANEIMADENATAEDVEKAITELEVAVNALEEVKEEEKVVDKKALQDAINEAKGHKESDYTVESYKALTEALANANAINDNKDATQDDVNAATKTLKDAIEGLEKVAPTPGEVNKSQLDAIIKQALALQKEDYTAETWAKLQQALSVAQQVFANGESTQNDVDNAVNTLDTAIKELVKVDKSQGKPDDTNNGKPNGNKPNNNKPGKGDKLPATGGTPAAAVGLFGAITSILGVSIFKKKRK